MVVKIIDPKPHESVVKQKICLNCGATLEYVPNDVKKYEGRDYSGGPDGHEWIDCPQCNKKVILKSW
jgi:DNA-directed RNA polymerase subunit RPC12/RpoP